MSKNKKRKAKQPKIFSKDTSTKEKQKKPEYKPLKFDLSRYKVTGDKKTASGRNSVDNNDPIAQALRGDSLATAYKKTAFYMRILGRESAVTNRALKLRYGHLNLGMQRMSLGNLIRGAAKSVGIKRLPKYTEERT